MASLSDRERLKSESLKENNDDEALPEESDDKEKRIFINHIDTYHGKNLARYFARVKPGTSLYTGDEEKNSQKWKIINEEQPLEDGWKVSGTVKDPSKYVQLPFIHEIFQSNNQDQLFEHLIEMNVIIYDITQDSTQVDEAIWVCHKLESLIKRLTHQITFILVSTIMTWAKTQPNDEDIPFSEDEFRRRRAHPHYKEHHAAEKLVTKMNQTNKKRLSTYIVTAGFTYGMGEGLFHYIFKSAWYNLPEISVYGKGLNYLPTIHIMDLAAVLQHLADYHYKVRYIIATDTSRDTLIQITRKISQVLGYGKIKIVEQEEAMLNKDITQTDYEMLFINMKIEPMFIKEYLTMKWHCQDGLIENIQKVVEEYRIQRNLTPIKICILGPPASGKTTIAKQLAQEYKLHHIQIRDVIDDTKYELEQLLKGNNDQDQNDDNTFEDEPEIVVHERMEEAKSILDKIKEYRRDSKYARLDDETLTYIFKRKLMSPPCQNQGYILDGYPKTLDQAQILFGTLPREEGEEEGDEKRMIPINEHIMPDFIFILEAENTFLRQRIMHLSERLVAGTHNTELEFRRRLKIYNDLGDDFHPAKYFEELERLCEAIKIDDDQSINHRAIVEKMMERIQKPHNYGLTAEEEEMAKQRELYEKEKQEREEQEERERELQEATNERIRKQKEWTRKSEQIQRDQQQFLDIQSLPLRNYLMKHVMPTLTKALIECCQVQPEDPIDFVAEYLFKNNPQM